ncbi:MAG: hypothetical protein U0T82_06180 [Bacteroidales bacterium]
MGSTLPRKVFVPLHMAFSGLAELGFIIVQLDPGWEPRPFKSIQDAGKTSSAGFPDRILWIQAAAAKISYGYRPGWDFSEDLQGLGTLAGLLFPSGVFIRPVPLHAVVMTTGWIRSGGMNNGWGTLLDRSMQIFRCGKRR